MDYTIERGFRGKKTVAFGCPHCGFALQSPLEEAGNRYECPSCHVELPVPGAKELKELRVQQAHVAEEKARAEDARLAEETARAEQRASEARARAHREAENAREKEARKAERANARRNSSISPTMLSVTTLLMAFGVVALVYLTMVRPLQRRLSDTQRVVDDLRVTVNRNAEAANRTATALASLTETVNHNADAGNRATAALSRNLAETDRLARNADRNAHSHTRY